MRILHLLQNFPPEFTGGTERYVLQLARAQGEMGHEPLVVCGSEEVRPAGETNPFTWEGLPCLRLHRRPEEAYSLVPRHPRLGEKVAQIAADQGMEAAHIHHWFNLDLDLARRLRRAGLPVLITLHDFFALCPRFFRRGPGALDPCSPGRPLATCTSCVAAEAGQAAATGLLERRQEFQGEFQAAGRAVVFSRAMLEFFEQEPGLPPMEYHLLAPGIDEADLWQAQAGRQPAGPPWKVGYWGGICRAKGLDQAVRVLARREFAGRVEFHLWGPLLEQDLVAEMEETATAAGLPLLLHGPTPAGELPAAIGDLACALFPSRCFESYGLAVDEALLAGLPLVVARAGALAERLGSRDLTFTPGREEEMAQALDRVLADPAAHRGHAHQVPLFADHVPAVTALYRPAR